MSEVKPEYITKQDLFDYVKNNPQKSQPAKSSEQMNQESMIAEAIYDSTQSLVTVLEKQNALISMLITSVEQRN